MSVRKNSHRRNSGGGWGADHWHLGSAARLRLRDERRARQQQPQTRPLLLLVVLLLALVTLAVAALNWVRPRETAQQLRQPQAPVCRDRVDDCEEASCADPLYAIAHGCRRTCGLCNVAKWRQAIAAIGAPLTEAPTAAAARAAPGASPGRGAAHPAHATASGLFEKMDHDGNLRVSLHEFLYHGHHHVKGGADADAVSHLAEKDQALFETYDANGDGELELAEFVVLMFGPTGLVLGPADSWETKDIHLAAGA